MAKQISKMLGCEYGGFSGKGEKIRIGVNIPRSSMSHEEAEALFCGSQLKVLMTADSLGKGDADGQKTLIETTDTKVEVVVESRRVTFDSSEYHISLLIPDGDIDMSAIKRLTGKNGKIKATRTGDATGGKDNDETEA